MEYVNVVPTLLSAVGGFVVALAIAGLVRKVSAFIEKIEL